MLYSIDIEAPGGRDEEGNAFHEEWIIEAPRGRWAPSRNTVVFNRHLVAWIGERAREASIRWGVEVTVKVYNYFPARVGYGKGHVVPCVRHQVDEYKRYYKRETLPDWMVSS